MNEKSFKIKHVRYCLGLNQSQFAAILNVHYMTVSKWERDILTIDPYQESLIDMFRDVIHVSQHLRIDIKHSVRKTLIERGSIETLYQLLNLYFTKVKNEMSKL